MKLLLVAGARPNFVKLSPITDELLLRGVDYKLIHTGQHYSEKLSDVFFIELGIKQPDYNLEIGSGPHAQQTAKIIHKFADVCEIEKPDTVLVIGDVNSTLACAVVVSKLENVKLAHVEAGERSFDKSMPEEINRLVTDVLSDYLFCSSPAAKSNLIAEGYPEEKIYLVGNVAIDSLLFNSARVSEYDYDNDPYVLCTIHRQSNTDVPDVLKNILKAFQLIANDIKVTFPMHPRTQNRIDAFGFNHYLKGLNVIKPLNYLNFLYNMKHATAVLTDSGGVQVETTVLDVPCVTIRNNTEWGFTLSEGTNTIVGTDINKIVTTTLSIVRGERKHTNLSTDNAKLLDGHASRRIVEVLLGGNNV